MDGLILTPRAAAVFPLIPGGQAVFPLIPGGQVCLSSFFLPPVEKVRTKDVTPSTRDGERTAMTVFFYGW
jgi:hypothetical protein